MMRNYEALFIIDPTIGEEPIKGLVEKFKGLIESSATLTSLDEWGKRRLAYPINGSNEGHYVLLNFEANSNLPAELERVFKITDGIMKYLVVKKEK